MTTITPWITVMARVMASMDTAGGRCVSSAQHRHHRRQADRQQPGGGLGPGAGVAEVTLAEAHVHLQPALH